MNYKPLTLVAYCKSHSVLFNSSSGGIFHALATYVLNVLNGTVFGCTIEGSSVFHKRITSVGELKSLMKSKYVQSDLKSTFKECEQDLLNNRQVLFAGTPCIIYSLKKYLSNDKILNLENLITVDFVCHGTPSKKYWKSYCSERFNNKIN